MIFHKTKHTIIGNLNNKSIHFTHDLNDHSVNEENIVKHFIEENFINTIKESPLKSVYLFNKHILLVIDSMSVYNIKTFKPDYVLLRQSPKINLNRLIDSIHPKQIIADGSNYKSYVAHWKAICKKRGLPFHYTNEKGAFILDH